MSSEFTLRQVQNWMISIVNNYPLIYLEGAAENNWEVNLRYGAEHGEGWKNLIEEFAKKATDIVLRAREQDKDSYIHGCIQKEKFGLLTIQFDFNLSKEFQQQYYDLLRDASDKSSKTCEKCGAAGTLTKKGWITVLCSGCGNK